MSALGIVSVALGYHGHIGGDVSVAPVGVAHSRFYFRDVEQLVDECQQTVALPLYGLGFLPHALRAVFVLCEVMAQAQYDGERRAELVGDVGEEVFAHGGHLL